MLDDVSFLTESQHLDALMVFRDKFLLHSSKLVRKLASQLFKGECSRSSIAVKTLDDFFARLSSCVWEHKSTLDRTLQVVDAHELRQILSTSTSSSVASGTVSSGNWASSQQQQQHSLGAQLLILPESTVRVTCSGSGSGSESSAISSGQPLKRSRASVA